MGTQRRVSVKGTPDPHTCLTSQVQPGRGCVSIQEAPAPGSWLPSPWSPVALIVVGHETAPHPHWLCSRAFEWDLPDRGTQGGAGSLEGVQGPHPAPPHTNECGWAGARRHGESPGHGTRTAKAGLPYVHPHNLPPGPSLEPGKLWAGVMGVGAPFIGGSEWTSPGGGRGFLTLQGHPCCHWPPVSRQYPSPKASLTVPTPEGGSGVGWAVGSWEGAAAGLGAPGAERGRMSHGLRPCGRCVYRTLEARRRA